MFQMQDSNMKCLRMRVRKGEERTYCNAGALCLPPSKPAGKTDNDALPAPPPMGPRFRDSLPAVPGWEEVSKPGSRAQHSRVERLFWALRTVMFSVFVVGPVLVKARVRVGIVRNGRR